jgi:hypothetical protein
MLKVENNWYRQCTICLIWFHVYEIGWSDTQRSWLTLPMLHFSKQACPFPTYAS